MDQNGNYGWPYNGQRGYTGGYGNTGYGGGSTGYNTGAGYSQPGSTYVPQMYAGRVNGRGGADAFQMGPYSTAFLLDESGLIMWIATTDGAGYKTIVPYDLTPHQDVPAPDYNSLEGRIAKLEGFMNEYNAASATATRKRKTSDGNGESD